VVTELALRFLIGGLVVSAFSLLGDLFQPKSFAGLFAAAPSVALATLGLTVAKDGGVRGAIEAGAMTAGAVALIAYCWCVSWLLMRRNLSSLAASSVALPVWFAVAFGGLWLARRL
jgi:hypothetical protein